MAGLEDVGQKEVREPQSDEEESKEKNSFGKQLSNHGQMFVNALKNLEIVQENDIAGLKAGKTTNSEKLTGWRSLNQSAKSR